MINGGYGVSSPPAAAGGGYSFTWADATARMAQAVTSNEFGQRGYQQDMQLGYEAVEDGAGGFRWARLNDPRVVMRRGLFPVNNAANFTVDGLATAAPTTPLGSGVSARNASAGTNKATRQTRAGLATVAGAGNRASCRFGGSDAANNPLVPTAGFRSRVATVLNNTSANASWTTMAFGDALFGGAANPNAQTNVLAMGRFAQANLQIYCNDAAGLCTEQDCGASFPAITQGEGYELEVFTWDGTEWVAQVTRVNTGDAFSATFSSNLPAAAQGGFGWFVNNVGDAASINATDIVYWIGEYFNVSP